MPSKFNASVEKRDAFTMVKLGGVIDEDNDLAGLSEQLADGTLVIDVSEIERINSCGVRDWVNWLGTVEGRGGKVVLVQCSPSIVAQVNLVNNFTGGGVVKSFYAPYFCPRCDREKALLIETRDAAGKQPYKAPTCRCDECDGPMDFDDMEESYFAFLANQTKLADASLDELLGGKQGSDSGQRLRTRSSGSIPGAIPGQASGAVAGSLPSVGGPSSPMSIPASGAAGSLPTRRTPDKMESGTGKVPLAGTGPGNTGRVPLAVGGGGTGKVPLAAAMAMGGTGKVPLAAPGGGTGKVPLAGPGNTGRVPLAVPATGSGPLGTGNTGPVRRDATGSGSMAITSKGAAFSADPTVLTPAPPSDSSRVFLAIGLLIAVALGLMAWLFFNQ